MEKLTKRFLADIDAVDKNLDVIAESVFQMLLGKCDNLAELESRVFHFDSYPGLPVEKAHLCKMVAHRVRTIGKDYIDTIKSQHKIVSGE